MLKHLWYGPHREPLCLKPDVIPFNSSATIPYFGIIPRGLLKRLEQIQSLQHPDEWNRIAPWLELGLFAFGAEEWEAFLNKVDLPVSDRLPPWLAIAKEVGVLSLQATANLCASFLCNFLADEKAVSCLLQQLGYAEDCLEDISNVDVWLVKEGHTSSVWRVELRGEAFHPSVVFCMNVARDSEAGCELVDSYAHLVSWYNRDPTHVAKPLLLETVETNLAGRTISLPITLHAWINGRELHMRPSKDGSAEFIEVEWFVSEQTQNQGKQYILGRALTVTEKQQLWDRLLTFFIRHSSLNADRTEVVVPGLEINEGDLVWAGDDIIVVAASVLTSKFTTYAWQDFSENPYLYLWQGGPKLYRQQVTTVY
jgi:hypothetical protein